MRLGTPRVQVADRLREPRVGRRSPWCWLGFALLLLPGCDKHTDTVFYPLSVEFAQSSSEAIEGDESVEIVVRLNAPSDVAVEAAYRVNDVTASGHDACGARDYSLTSGSLSFEPGQVQRVITLRHLDDDLNELDEQLTLELEAVAGAVLGDTTSHRHTILDDDRELLVNVQVDFGAAGNGRTDDTEAIQAAVDRASLSSASVVWFPPGEYLVTSLELPPAVSYFGYQATLLQAPDQPTDAQLLRMRYDGDDDSPITLVQGLTLDGRRDLQGPFTDWQYQESDLFDAMGDPQRPGRLRLVMEALTFKDTGGNGLMLNTNTDSVLCRLEGDDVFTDVVKLAGGYSQLVLREVTGNGTVSTTGIAITGQNRGYGEVATVDVTLEDVQLLTGDLEIDIRDESNLTASGIVMAQAPFYLRAVRSSVHISDSALVVGAPLLRYNRLVAPNDVTFENCDLTLTETVEPALAEPEADRELMIASVTWDDVNYAFAEGDPDELVEKLTGQSLRFRGCRFHLADDVEDSDTVYVAGTLSGDDQGQTLVIERAEIADGFDGVFAPGCSACVMTP